MEKLKATPKDFFLWLGAMGALYVSVVSIVLLKFEYINYFFPDPLERTYYMMGDPYSGSIRFAMASLIVVVPLYLFLTRILNQDIRQNPEKKDLWVRRWVIFLTLFVAGTTLVIDLITLINTFLQGELTVRFALKVLTVLVVVGAGFLYYLMDLRGVWERKETISKTIGWIVAFGVLASVFSGFFIIGSPTTQRLYRADDQRVADLQSVQWQVVSFWQQKEKLPVQLTELEDSISGFIVPVDPETNVPYTYRTTATASFELCTIFNKESRDRSSVNGSISMPYPVMEGENWTHPAGEYCFKRTIDPDRYPPFEKPARI